MNLIPFPWNYIAAGALALSIVGGLIGYGAHRQATHDAAKSAAETIDNLHARGKIDAGLANASKDDLCRKLEASRWNEGTKECE